MPIELQQHGTVLHTVLVGRVTNDELLAHYERPPFHEPRDVWREVVDGRLMTDMAITVDGQRRLADMALAFVDKLRGGRVAMVAATDEAYGMFRMWEMQREGLGYDVQVFRNFAEAMEWVASDLAPVGRA
jgi:hypothetical protein